MFDSDDATLKQITRRTSPVGRAVAILLIGGAVALGYFHMQSSARYEARMDGVIAAGKLGDREQMLASLRAELGKSSYDDVRERVLRNLGHFRDEAAVPLMINALDDAGIVRRAAALALARVGSPAADAAKPKLLEVLPNTDARDRPQVVWALAVLAEPQAADAILAQFTKGMLQGQPGFDPKVIITALGPQRLGSEDLTNHADTSVRALTAMALAEAASPDVVAPLLRMLQRPDEDPEVLRSVAGGLARTGDPRAALPLFQMMQQRDDLRRSMLDALRKSTAAPELAKLLGEAKDSNIKSDIAGILRATHDPRAADALAGLLQDESQDVRIEAAHGLAELGDARAVPALLTLAKDEDDTLSQNAIDALRDLAHPEAGPALLALLPEFPYRKASILRALGASGATQAGPAIERDLKGDDVAAAAKALGQIKYEPAFKKLLAMVKRPKGVDFTKPSVSSEMAYRTRIEAIRALAYFGRPAAADPLMTVVEDPDDDMRIRLAAGEALGLIADAALQDRLLSKIQDEKQPEANRVAYVQGLWQKPHASLSSRLLPLIESEAPAAVRRAAALAVGYAGNPSNDTRLMQMLDSPKSRRDAAFAIVLGGSEEAANKLLQVMAEDRDLREVLQLAVMSTEDDNFNVLTEAMFESGQVLRRLQVAHILREGGETGASYGYAWSQLTARLRSGWDGPGGVHARFARGKVYDTLTRHESQAVRVLAAQALASMNERGLLVAARDSAHPGAQQARELLLSMDKPRS